MSRNIRDNNGCFNINSFKSNQVYAGFCVSGNYYCAQISIRSIQHFLYHLHSGSQGDSPSIHQSTMYQCSLCQCDIVVIHTSTNNNNPVGQDIRNGNVLYYIYQISLCYQLLFVLLRCRSPSDYVITLFKLAVVQDTCDKRIQSYHPLFYDEGSLR